MIDLTTWKTDAKTRRQRRIEARVTLADLAERVGLSESQLSRYERGKAAARADIIEQWESQLKTLEANRV